MLPHGFSGLAYPPPDTKVAKYLNQVLSEALIKERYMLFLTNLFKVVHDRLDEVCPGPVGSENELAGKWADYLEMGDSRQRLYDEVLRICTKVEGSPLLALQVSTKYNPVLRFRLIFKSKSAAIEHMPFTRSQN